MADDIELRHGASKPGDSEIYTLEAAPPETAADASKQVGKDRAADFLNAVGGPVVVTAEDNKRILRKVDLVILPVIIGIYILQFLDKATLASASVFGIIKDAHLVGNQYSWLGGIVYLAQLILQPTVAYLLVKLPIGKFTATMALCWGSVLCLMAAAKNFGGLMATRFFLGAFEASVGMFLWMVRSMSN